MCLQGFTSFDQVLDVQARSFIWFSSHSLSISPSTRTVLIGDFICPPVTRGVWIKSSLSAPTPCRQGVGRRGRRARCRARRCSSGGSPRRRCGLADTRTRPRRPAPATSRKQASSFEDCDRNTSNGEVLDKVAKSDTRNRERKCAENYNK